MVAGERDVFCLHCGADFRVGDAIVDICPACEAAAERMEGGWLI